LGYIFWDNSQALTPQEQERILQHERVHVTQGHSYDLLYLEVLTVLFWCNPLLYLYKKALLVTHEFLADAHVIQTQDKTAYGLLLAKQVLQKNNFALGHHFNTSLTLKRLKMIHAPNRRTSKVKQVLAFPLLGLLALSLSSTQLIPTEPVLQLPFLTEAAPTPQKLIKAEFLPKEGAEMMKYLLRHVKLPVQAKANQEYGGVFAQITLSKEGNIENIKILEAAYPSLEKEIIRVLKTAPGWSTTNAKWTPSTFIYPFEFRKTTKEGHSAEAEQNFQKLLIQVISKANDAEVKVVQPMIIGKFEGEKPSGTTQTTQIHSQTSSAISEPHFPGGKKELMKFIGQTFRIPLEASKNNYYGGVFVQATIEKDGTPGNFKVVQGSQELLDQEALRVIQKMPKWEASGASTTYIFPVSVIIDGFKNDKKVINQKFEQTLAQVAAQATAKSIRIADPVVVVGYGPEE
jgi:outer membrane biosynthesis protein TonB